MSKADYDFYKIHGICVKCGRSDAEPGHVMCGVCAGKQAESRLAKWSALSAEEKDAARAKGREKRNALRRKRRADGLCIYCGKPGYNGGACCYEHMLENRRRQRERTAKKSFGEAGRSMPIVQQTGTSGV